LSKLPQLSGQDVCNALGKLGFVVDRQKGSHIILRNNDPPYRRLTIPTTRSSPKERSVPSFTKPG